MSHRQTDDPARDLAPAAYGHEATMMMQRILTSPAHETAHRPGARRPASLKRVVFAGLVTAAAASVAVIAPMPWNDGHPGLASAYAVDRNGDGSVSVTVHWDQLRQPASLQRSLDAAGARVRLLTGTADSGTPAPDVARVPECAQPYSGRPYSSAAVSWDSGRNAPDNSFVIHPAAFPTHGTLVIEVFFNPGSGRWVSTLSFMAIGKVPSCAISG
jgi:hypothetical protein